MGKKKNTETMEEFLEEADKFINVEPHLDPTIIEREGFLRRVVTTAGLWKFVTIMPMKILAKPVGELLLNLRKGQNTSSFSDPQNGEPVEVDLSDLIDVFDLPKDGGDSLLDLGYSAGVQYGRFAVEGAEPNFKKASIRTSLKAPFNLVCELFTKSIACYVGNLETLSETKLIATAIIVDSLTGTSFNWHGWFLKQIHEAAGDFAFVRGSTDQILRKGKLKFFSRLSVALEIKYPGKVWPVSDVIAYNKQSIYHDKWRKTKTLMDLGLLEVVVPVARPVAERQAEVSQARQVASPGKRAAPKRGKKLKRVASLVQESEAMEKPLEDTEVTQPQTQAIQTQPSQIQTQPQFPPIQTQTPQLQIQTQTQISSTAQHQTHKSPHEEDTGSSFKIPEIPLLHVDPIEAYTTFKPFQSLQTQPPPTEPIQISETQETSSPSQSPSTSAATADTAQTVGEVPIIPSFIPPALTEQKQALERYIKEREQAADTINRRYSNVPWSNIFYTNVVDFLTYITYRGTEYYKIYRLLKAFKEEELINLEAKLLNFIGASGFHEFLDGTSFWDKLDAKVKEAYPLAIIPKRVPTAQERKLIREHKEEVEVKEAEIASLHSEITKMSEEMEKKAGEIVSLREDFDKKRKELEGTVEKKERLLEEKEKALEAQVKLVESQTTSITELKDSLDAERSRLREVNANLIAAEKEKKELEKKVKKLKEDLENKEGELVMEGSKLLSTKKALDSLKTEMKLLKEESETDKKELESLRKNAQAIDLKNAELSILLQKVKTLGETYTEKMAASAEFHLSLNQRERSLETMQAELLAAQEFWYFNLQEEKADIRREIEAELEARFREVEPLERMMASIVEREKQCEYLLEEISIKTADLVAPSMEKNEQMLQTILNAVNSLNQSISGKSLILTPGSDDAKKGEGQMELGGIGGSKVGMESMIEGSSGNGGAEEVVDEARALGEVKGKTKLTEEELLKKPEEPSRPLHEKVLSASIERHPPVTVVTKEERRKQVEQDAAMAWEMEQLSKLTKNSIAAGTSSSAKAAASSQAPASAAALASSASPATTAALTSSAVVPSSAVTRKDMPPPPPPKLPLKRAAPESKGDDSAAKRHQVKHAVASRTEKEGRKRKEREGGRSEVERSKKVNTRRLQVIDARIEEQFSEVLLIQSSLVRSAFIPFMPDESEACEAQAIKDACDVTTKEMVESGRYPKEEEQNYIRKRLNEKRPLWSGESGKRFTEIMTKMSKRTEEELAKRRNEHPDAREIEDFIPRDLREQWLYYKNLFIKAYYYWEVVPLQDECSRISALNNFLATYDDKLRRKIFTMAEQAEPKPIVVKVPAIKDFPMPYHPGTDIPNRGVIDKEVDEAFNLESAWRRPSIHTVGTMESRVLSAYVDIADERELKRVEERKKKEEEDEAAGNR